MQRLTVIGCNHHQTSLQIRERMALTAADVDNLVAAIREHSAVDEAVLLSTCNRVEIYAVTNAGNWLADFAAMLERVNGFPANEFLQHAYAYEGLATVQHAFRVASGLDSQMVGETQILGQMKSAYRDADALGMVGASLHRVFQKAFQAAKWARSSTQIGIGQISLGNVGVELATRIFGVLTVSRTLVVGSGEIGREVAKAFRSRGVACMTIASRTPERALDLAQQIDGLTIPFKLWEDHLPFADIVIFATTAPSILLGPDVLVQAMGKRRHRPMFLMDLAMPRDVDAAVGDIENIYLYNLEDLAAIANENLAVRQAEVENCLTVLNQRAAAVWDRLGTIAATSFQASPVRANPSPFPE